MLSSRYLCLLQVFINPAVAALPQHAHLFYEPGCYVNRKDGVLYQRECGEGPKGEKETPLPDHWKPLVLTPEQDDVWHNWVKSRVEAGT